MSREQRITLRILGVGAAALLALWLCVLLFGDRLIQAVLSGQALGYLGRLIRVHMTNNPAHSEPEFYVELATSAVGRALLLWVLLGAVLIYLQRIRPTLISDNWNAPDHAENLAVTRMVVFVALASIVRVSYLTNLAADAELMRAPALMGWFLEVVPITAELVEWAAVALIVVSLLAAFGFLTHMTAPVAVLLAIYVLGIPNYFGKINHAHHAIVWFAAVLAASPCGEAFSFDAAVWKKERRSPSRRYGRPLHYIWLLFCVIYFIPGVWKFVLSGWEWIFSDNLKYKMYSSWRVQGHLPDVRLDRYPAVYMGMAGFGMLWELAFPFLILFRKTRIAALFGGLLFHTGVAYVMLIVIPKVWTGYVAFIDWKGRWRRLRRKPAIPAKQALPWRLTNVVGTGLVGLTTLFGIFLVNSWPLSVYPTHAGIRGPTYRSVEMDIYYENGVIEHVDLRSLVPTTSQGIDFRVLASGSIDQADEDYLRQLAFNWLEVNSARLVNVIQFEAVERKLDPDSIKEEPVEKETLLRLTLDG